MQSSCLLVGSRCCDRNTWLCSAASRTAQAIHSSHKQPLLATCMLIAPHFLPPAAVTSRAAAAEPSSIPPNYPCSTKQRCGADGHACVWRKAKHQWLCQGHQTPFEDPQTLSSPQGPSLGLSFALLCLAELLC